MLSGFQFFGREVLAAQSTIANAVAREAGRPWVFSLAMLLVIIWGATGPFFDFRHMAAGDKYLNDNRNLLGEALFR